MNRQGIRKAVDRLRARTDPSPLVPEGVWDRKLDREIEGLVPPSAGDPEHAVQSALFLWNDSLERAHELAQEIGDATGSYLHGIMHRREPDYGNSKYWFRRVGAHPAFPKVRAAALALLERPATKALEKLRAEIEAAPDWDGFRMVDWCAASDRGRSPAEVTAFLRALQFREIAVLADWCLERAGV